MNRLLLIPVLFSIGCGAPLENMENECAVEGLKDVLAPQKKISCSNFSVNVAIAKQMMIDKGWIKDEAEFNQSYSSIVVTMRDERCLYGPHIGEIPLPGCIYGEYSPKDSYEGPSIDLDWDGGALGHEFMHHYDYLHGRGDVSYKHQDWKELGYYKFADEYAAAALRLN